MGFIWCPQRRSFRHITRSNVTQIGNASDDIDDEIEAMFDEGNAGNNAEDFAENNEQTEEDVGEGAGQSDMVRVLAQMQQMELHMREDLAAQN